jgi:hypothetical protein
MEYREEGSGFEKIGLLEKEHFDTNYEGGKI